MYEEEGCFISLHDGGLISEEVKNSLAELKKVCEKGTLKLKNNGIHRDITRENIYEVILSIYQNEEILCEVLTLSFDGETGVGDGVTKDIYSMFFTQFYDMCDGGHQRVPLRTTESKELVIVGRVITHAFIQYRQFPIELCKASIEHSFFG